MRFALGLGLLVVLLVPAIVQAQEVTRSNTVQADCGSIIEDEFTVNFQENSYSINLNAGDAISVSLSPLGAGLRTGLFLSGPTDLTVATTSGNIRDNGDLWYVNPMNAPVLTTEPLAARGSHLIRVVNWATSFYANRNGYSSGAPSGVGVYTLFIGCTLRDGTTIEPGQSVQGEAPSSSDVETLVEAFSGFGFPGVAPRDFSDGIELPLTLGQAQVAPVGGDVALYTYDATAGQVATLSLSRVSGDLSLGVAVINRETNALVFLGGMPTSNNLSVELTFPEAGTYVIGLFRLDTPQASGTSGAVQITLE